MVDGGWAHVFCRFHGRACWRDFSIVRWSLIRGVPNVAIQESAVLFYVCRDCDTRMGLWIQWYVAMSAYHASSESAHPRLMESDDVVCFSLFSCSGLVSLHV